MCPEHAETYDSDDDDNNNIEMNFFYFVILNMKTDVGKRYGKVYV